MTSNDPLADALNAIKVHETAGKSECDVLPNKLIRETLKILQSRGYIGDFEFVDDGRRGSFKVRLLGKVNDCGAVKPRFAVKRDEWPAWEQRFIPGVGFGVLFLIAVVFGVLSAIGWTGFQWSRRARRIDGGSS